MSDGKRRSGFGSARPNARSNSRPAVKRHSQDKNRAEKEPLSLAEEIAADIQRTGGVSGDFTSDSGDTHIAALQKMQIGAYGLLADRFQLTEGLLHRDTVGDGRHRRGHPATGAFLGILQQFFGIVPLVFLEEINVLGALVVLDFLE